MSGGTPGSDHPPVSAVSSLEAARPLFRAHAELCKALGHEHRIAIMHAVCRQERSVAELATALDLPAHTISQHLQVLRAQRLVRARKDGQTVYYVIANAKFMEACLLMQQALLEEHEAEGRSLRVAEALDAIKPRRPAPSESGHASIR